MSDLSLPKYKKPPVIETVLSAQFTQLEKYSNAHAGWFWKKYLSENWDQVIEAPRLEDQFTVFGQEWMPPGGRLLIQTQPSSERTQIVRSDNLRMIQIQNTRFVHNWRKSDDSDYPSYETLLPEFMEKFEKFKTFVKDSGNPELEINQWEVTYVNHIVQGDLWNDVNDWLSLFPKLGGLSDAVPNQKLDNFNGSWVFAIGENKGKLYVEMKQARIGGVSGPEGPKLIMLKLTARGPANSDMDLKSGFDLGHESIVNTFTDITSANSHKHWDKE